MMVKNPQIINMLSLRLFSEASAFSSSTWGKTCNANFLFLLWGTPFALSTAAGVGSVLVWVSAYLFPLCLLIKYFLLEPGDLWVIFIIASLYSVSLLNCWMKSRENQLVIFSLILCFNCASRKHGRGGHSLSVSSNWACPFNDTALCLIRFLPADLQGHQR